MKGKKQLNKRKEKGRGRGTADQGEKKRERKGENGAQALLYRPLSHLMYFLSIYLVRNPLPVDVGTIDRITSNICVDCCVFSLKLAVKRFQRINF
jgi:hypothetical protein